MSLLRTTNADPGRHAAASAWNARMPVLPSPEQVAGSKATLLVTAVDDVRSMRAALKVDVRPAEHRYGTRTTTPAPADWTLARDGRLTTRVGLENLAALSSTCAARTVRLSVAKRHPDSSQNANEAVTKTAPAAKGAPMVAPVLSGSADETATLYVVAAPEHVTARLP